LEHDYEASKPLMQAGYSSRLDPSYNGDNSHLYHYINLAGYPKVLSLHLSEPWGNCIIVFVDGTCAYLKVNFGDQDDYLLRRLNIAGKWGYKLMQTSQLKEKVHNILRYNEYNDQKSCDEERMVIAFTKENLGKLDHAYQDTFVNLLSNDFEVNLKFRKIGKVKKIFNFKPSLYVLFDSGRLFRFDWSDTVSKNESIFEYKDSIASGDVESSSNDQQKIVKLYQLKPVNTFKMYEKLGYNKACIEDF
jgi:hypothetical protein